MVCIGTAAVTAWLLASAARGAVLRAERILEETAGDLIIGGPDAIGGVGDWYLANDVVEVIVDDPSRRNGALNYGGTIVDAGLRDRSGEDQFARLFPVVNMDQKVFVNYDAITAEVDDAAGWARLRVSTTRGMSSLPRATGLLRWLNPLVPKPESLSSVRVETEYAVFRGEPFVHITTTLHNQGEKSAPVFAYGDVWMRGGRSMRSFVGNALEPERSVGYHHRSFDRSNLAAAGDAMVPMTHVVVPGVQQFPPIGYALVAPERAARGWVNFGVTDQQVTFINAFTFDPDWRELSIWRIARATRRKIPAGGTWTYRRRLLIVGHADVASATDRIFPLLGVADEDTGIQGRVEPPDMPCAVHVYASDTGAPVTQILTSTRGSEAGRYRAVLPPGAYHLILRAPQRPTRELEVAVEAGRFSDVPPQTFLEPGWLVFDPAFTERAPGRIVVRGVGATPDPRFGPELLDFRIDGVRGKSGTETHDLHFAGSHADPHRVALPPGRYRLVATRGPEFDIAEIELHVTAGESMQVMPFDLPRIIDLRPFLSADLHVHAQASDDSAMPNAARLRSMIAEGLDVMVSTDHENLGQYGPALDALGVRDRIRVIQGVEVTSSAPSPAAPWTIGHHNTWPVRYQAHRHRRGAPPSQDIRLADLYALLRRDYGVQVVQLNHPRGGTPGKLEAGGFFTHLGSAGEPYDSTRSLTEEPNARLLAVGSDGRTRAIDFDAMELMNGDSYAQYRLIRRDWYSLLVQGFPRTGTANSDSHGPDAIAGYPRNYVAMESETWDLSKFNAAIREGRLFGTNGPLIPRFRVNGASMGDRVVAPHGRVEIEFEVVAAPWVPVDEVRLVVNGEIERVYPLDPLSIRGSRLAKRVILSLTRDAAITIEAGASLDTDARTWKLEHPGAYTEDIAPGFVPTAFTNPVYVDFDLDGRFDLPGPVSAEGGSTLGRTGLLVAAAGIVVLWLFIRQRRKRERIP